MAARGKRGRGGFERLRRVRQGCPGQAGRVALHRCGQRRHGVTRGDFEPVDGERDVDHPLRRIFRLRRRLDERGRRDGQPRQPDGRGVHRVIAVEIGIEREVRSVRHRADQRLAGVEPLRQRGRGGICLRGVRRAELGVARGVDHQRRVEGSGLGRADERPPHLGQIGAAVVSFCAKEMSSIDCLMNIAVSSTSGTADSVIINHSRAGIDKRELMNRIMSTALYCGACSISACNTLVNVELRDAAYTLGAITHTAKIKRNNIAGINPGRAPSRRGRGAPWTVGLVQAAPSLDASAAGASSAGGAAAAAASASFAAAAAFSAAAV